MAYDEGLLEILRTDVRDVAGITEKRMFGGVVLMLDGNMLAGVHRDGAMFRVGKDRQAAARAIPGTGPMAFTGRPMGGMVEADADLMADDDRRGALLALAMDHARSLPPK